MQPLEKTLRSKLERTVREARDIAEAAARASVEQLGVGVPTTFSYLSQEERDLRKKLCAHGRQLGDVRDPDGRQETTRLMEEVAYEHWHRMLFARFLAENNLLMYPDPVNSIPVTLEECEDLAADKGAKNGWELASRFAAKMLPQIFRPDSPVFQITLPPEHQQKLEKLLAELPAEVFSASDSLGWVYQFWQAKKKEEINKSEVKIGARELPVVTQLFTEPYMVAFLLDNSLGAWWAARRLSEEDLKNAKDEEELRQKASLPGVPLDYLRFVRGEDDRWAPAAGTFDSWPKSLKELKALDPCTGSGHFLVAALLMLTPMRMELDELSAREAVDAVLRENLYGLEIDPRCVELAAFNLAWTAWRYPDADGYHQLPELNLACSGLSISASKDDWLALAEDGSNLQLALEELYQQFKDAPVLGSLIDPRKGLFEGNLLGLKWDDIAPLLSRALSGEPDYEKKEMGVVAQGIAKAALLLVDKYHLAITNPPYLVRGKQSARLQNFLSLYYKHGDADLATVFLKRCANFAKAEGTHATVTPQNWLFLKSYNKMRNEILTTVCLKHVARVGSGATAKASWDVLRVLAIITNKNTSQSDVITGVNVTSADEANRAEELQIGAIKQVEQVKQLKNPDSRITLEELDVSKLLSNFAISVEGLSSGDLERFIQNFWEQNKIDETIWQLFQRSPDSQIEFNGCDSVLRWENGNGDLARSSQARIQGHAAWGKCGIIVNLMRSLHCSIYLGARHDKITAVITPNDNSHLPAIWAYCSSPDFNAEVRKLNSALQPGTGTLIKVPFDLERWQKVAAERYPSGLPKPYSDDPTQWIFHGHPAQSEHPLQVAVARLLGYRWPAELDLEMELSEEARAWVMKCKELLKFADEDGIVCIPPVRGEAAASDYLLNLLAAAYGPDWSTDKLSELLKQADHAGKSLESWLRDRFFVQHCKLFHHRPFIWHIWDGLNDGFAALVNYHKLDAKLLESLIYTYLGDWISRQKDDIRNGVDGAEEKLAAAEALKKRLELILEGEEPYDIFVRWKTLEKQPIGWNPDLNDGVRLNIRPFLSVPDVGKKGAGVLREKPNINWNKDRGKDVESAPWYHRFGGDRINDHHLRLEDKRDARKAEAKEGNKCD